MEYRPVASWLRSTRLRQTRDDGEPWTQDFLLDRMRSEIGWAPARPNYSRYESGRSTPNRETLAKLTAFWAQYDEPGPDLTPPKEPEPAPDLATLLIDQTKAISSLVDELRQERTARTSLESRLERLQAVVDQLAARALDPQGTPAPTGRGAPQG